MNVLLVRKIQLIAIKFQFLIHLPHIDGTHMIHYSVDGMSCGEIILGNLQTPVEELIIFHRHPFECITSLSAWLSTCIVTPF